MRFVRLSLIFGFLITAALMTAGSARAQDATLVARLLVAINNNRIANGLPPYALNPLLTIAAQRHSEYQATLGGWTHEGPGGTRALQRVQAVGYPAVRANENVYSGSTNPEEVANWWYTADADHRNNILHPVLREVGLGIAPDADGRLYWTMDISAQPNVLPIFINNDAYVTSSANVTLVLWNEGVFGPSGQIGRATQVMISNSPDFSGAVTQTWAQNINWTIDTNSGAGIKTVYVRFIDSYGTTADSQDSIVYDGASVNTIPIIPPIAIATLAPSVPPPPQATQPPLILQPSIGPTVITAPQPTATPTQLVAEVLPSGPPTVDYSTFRSSYPPPAAIMTDSSQTVLGISMVRIREILIGTLAFGIGLITIGLLAVHYSWKKHRKHPPQEEKADDGDDQRLADDPVQ